MFNCSYSPQILVCLIVQNVLFNMYERKPQTHVEQFIWHARRYTDTNRYPCKARQIQLLLSCQEYNLDFAMFMHLIQQNEFIPWNGKSGLVLEHETFDWQFWNKFFNNFIYCVQVPYIILTIIHVIYSIKKVSIQKLILLTKFLIQLF